MPPKTVPPSPELMKAFGVLLKPEPDVRKSRITQTVREIRATLPYPPSANRYWRNARGRTFVSKEAKEYKQAVKSEMQWLTPKPIEGAVAVTIAVYRPRRAGDLDNCIKVLLDALNGIAYADDKQVVQINAFRIDDKDNPRAEVLIKPAGVQP